MNELQNTIQKAYFLSDKDQNMLAKLIEVFILGAESGNGTNMSQKSIRKVGKFDGKYDVADDIDFCNDEIANMFGVND